MEPEQVDLNLEVIVDVQRRTIDAQAHQLVLLEAAVIQLQKEHDDGAP